MKFQKPIKERQETEVISLRLSKEDRDAFADACTIAAISISEGLRQLIKHFLTQKDQ